MTTHPYSPPNRRSLLPTALTLFAALSPALVLGQATAPVPPPSAPKPDADILRLSPFVVTEDSNVGYLATSTLAGTRLNSNLRDLGAAISVITPEFMKDTSVTNIEELFPYTMSTEIGGAFGNFSAAGLADAAGRPDQDASRREPQVGARVRGFAQPTYTRGYFTTSIATDSYNVGSITINRGANSLLFGLGSAGGVVETSPNSAIIGRNSGSASFRYGSHGSNRSKFDLNRTLIPGRLALRIDLLHKTDEFQQRPAYDRESRVYVALNGVVFENKNSRVLGKTVLRGNFESGKGSRTPPTSFAPSLGYEPFFIPPPNYRPFTGQDYPVGGGHAQLTANWRKWAVNDTRRIEVSPGNFQAGWYESAATAAQAGRPDLAAKNHSTSHIFAQIGVVYNGTGAAAIGIPGSNLQAFQGWFNQQPGQLSFTNPHISTRAYQDGAQNVGFKAPTLTDTNVFNYKDRLITGSLQEVNRRFDVSSITLEQSFFNNRLGFEGTFDKQFYHIDYYQPFGGSNRNVPVYIDTSLYLSDGSANPNVGRAFMLQQGDTDFWRNTYRHNKRVTGFYDLNFKDINPTLGKWLGRHTVTGLWQKESAEQRGLNFGMFWTGTNFEFSRSVQGATADAAVRNQTAFANQVVQFAYLSDDLRGKEMNQVRLNTIAMPRLRDGETFNAYYYDANPLNTTSSFRTVRPGVVRANRFGTGGVANKTDVTSKALAWQSRLFSENLVGLVGWREDKIENFRQIVTNARSLNNEYLASNLALRSIPTTTQEGKTFTWSAVGHLPRGLMAKLPRLVSGVTAHYGVSENFQAIAERHDVNNNPIPSPQGTTTEYGLTLGFNSNKWLVKINRFESDSRYSGILGTETSRSITEVTRPLNNYQASVNSNLPFTSLPNYNALVAAGYTSYDQLFAAIKNLIPQPARAIYDYQVINGTWQLPPGTQTIQGLSSTSDVVAKGWEVELTANPSKNWRVSLNAAQTEAVTSNSAGPLGQLQAAYVKNLNDSRLANIIEGPASITTMLGRYTQENISAVILQQAKDGAVSQELRKYRVNFVTNYKFTEGRLRGFGVGGGIRWQSKVGIGYATRLNQFNSQIPIISQPFFGPEVLNGDAWMSYSRKVTEKITWEIQLNARNLVGSQKDIPVAANPDGFRSLYRIAPERAWYVTNTFSF